MTQTQHFTSAATYTTPAGITRIRPVVAGGAGDPVTGYSGSAAGRGAILSALLATSAGSTFAIAFRNGGVRGTAAGVTGGTGGKAAAFGDIIAGGGAGAGGIQPGPDGAAPGVDAASPSGVSGTPPGGGKANGSGGAGGTNAGYPSGSAGAANGSGGLGGSGASTSASVFPSGGGGAGYGGGGGGSIAQPGAAGSSSGGASGASLTGYNTSSAYVDVFCASVPFAPTLITPIGNAWADRTAPIVLTFQHNGASTDALDAQSNADVQYRAVGASSWTTVTALGSATSYSIAAGTLIEGQQYEWQARTWSDGLVGPWSVSEYFTAATPPATPVITSPTASQQIGTAVIVVDWTHSGQVTYRARVVNDVAGSAGSLVYADSGPVSSSALTATLAVSVNSVDAHVQVRVQDLAGGLWSQWADVPVSIQWAPPPQPRVTLTPYPEHGSLLVTVVNPAGSGPVPTADYNDVYISEQIDGVYGAFERRATGVAPNTTWEYMLPAGDCLVRVDAIVTATQVQTSSPVIS